MTNVIGRRTFFARKSTRLAAALLAVLALYGRSAEAGQPSPSLVARTVTAMKAVRTMRSSGIWGATHVAFTGTCVTGGPSAFLSFHSTHTSWQVVLISKPVPRDWERYRRGTAPWGKWQPQATGPGDFNFPLLLPLACPHVSVHDWRLNNVSLQFHVAGSAIVRGRQTWHLSASARSARTTVDWYVDKTTYRLLRRRFVQLRPGGKAGYLEDVVYSGFNTALAVLPPH